MKTYLVVLSLTLTARLFAVVGEADEPVRVLNDGIDLTVHDGRLRPAIGVESIQVFRANRTRPDLSDGFGWTYNHAPMLAFWNGKFHLEYLSTPFGEHVPPGQTMIVRSEEHTSELQSRRDLVCRLLLEKKKTKK